MIERHYYKNKLVRLHRASFFDSDTPKPTQPSRALIRLATFLMISLTLTLTP